MIHELKILTQYFEQICKNEKTFEVRKDDREFHTGDFLFLREWDAEASFYTGREIMAKVTSHLRNSPWVKEKHIIMSIRVLDKPWEYI